MFNNYTMHEYIEMMLKRWWILVIGFILGGILSYTYSSYFINPTYVSRGTLYVNNKNYANTTGTLNPNDLNVSLKLVDTYRVILKSDKFMKTVAEKTGINFTPQQISSMVKLTGVENTEVLEVKVSSASPELAHNICQTILLNAKDEIIRVVEAGSVKTVDDASLPVTPSSPSVPRYTIIGMILSLAISIIISLTIELLDVSVKDEEDLVSQYGIPVVGSIPSLDESGIAQEKVRKRRGYIYEKQ